MNKFFGIILILLIATGCGSDPVNSDHTYNFEEEGGTVISVNLDPDCLSGNKINSDSIINTTHKIFESRLTKYGISKFNIVQMNHKLRIEILDDIDQKRIINLIQSRGDLGFYETYTNKEMYTSFLEADKKIRMLFESDSAFLSTKNEIGEKGISYLENPLVSLINMMLDEQYGAGFPSHESAMMGFALKTDTALISKCLIHPFVKRTFPNNLQFIWSEDIKDENSDSSIYVSLYMLKSIGYQKPALTSQYIKNAESVYNSDYGIYEINLRFTEDGSKLWKDLTAKNVNRQIAIVNDGILITAPMVQSVILGGNAVISGDLNETESKEIAAILSSGTLPCKCKVEVNAEGPEL